MRYKLIKDFPTCPLTVGSVVKEDYLGQYVSEGTIIFERNIIENYPEFWELLVDLNYEILETCPIEGTIYSVKRTLDNEVFTLGDKLDFGNFGDKGFQTIDKFEVDYFDKTRISAYNGCYGLGLAIWRKQEQPLFVTEDQVEIFKGDKFFVVDTQFSNYKLHQTVGGHFSKDKPNYKRFHSETEAEDFIIKNKPCLSMMDINRLCGSRFLSMNDLTELVKSKIKP